MSITTSHSLSTKTGDALAKTRGRVKNVDGQKRILIVDDDKTVLDSVVKLLKGAKYDCVTAMSSQEGIAKFQKIRPMVVLTDMIMEHNYRANPDSLESYSTRKFTGEDLQAFVDQYDLEGREGIGVLFIAGATGVAMAHSTRCISKGFTSSSTITTCLSEE